MNICTLVHMLHTIFCLHLLSYLDRTIGILYIVNPIQAHQRNYRYVYIHVYFIYIHMYSCIRIYFFTIPTCK